MTAFDSSLIFLARELLQGERLPVLAAARRFGKVTAADATDRLAIAYPAGGAWQMVQSIGDAEGNLTELVFDARDDTNLALDTVLGELGPVVGQFAPDHGGTTPMVVAPPGWDDLRVIVYVSGGPGTGSRNVDRISINRV